MGELELAQMRHKIDGYELQIKIFEKRVDSLLRECERGNQRLEIAEKNIQALLARFTGEVDTGSDDGAARNLNDLTPRQHILLQLFVQGFAYEQMAERMGVSINTVKTQAKAIRSKWGVANRSDLIFKARRALNVVSETAYSNLSGGIPKNWGDEFSRVPREEDPYWTLYKPSKGRNHEEDDEA